MPKLLTTRDQADRVVGDTFNGPNGEETLVGLGTGAGVDSWKPSAASAAVVDVEDADVVLIDLEPSNNQVCSFSTGENWADIKANYENLRFDFNISDSGRDLIVPHTITITPALLEQMLLVSGFSLFNDQGVAIDLNTLSNADRSFVYKQNSGDSPAGGRMQFKVTAIRSQKTVVGVPVTNADVSAGTYQIRKNADGTFELV